MPRQRKVENSTELDKNLTKTMNDFRVLEAERKENYDVFRATIGELSPLDKAQGWLSYIAEHREAESDLESVVFLASRGRDVAHYAMQLMGEWKSQEKEALADYNATHLHQPAIKARDIAGTSRVRFRDFSGRSR